MSKHAEVSGASDYQDAGYPPNGSTLVDLDATPFIPKDCTFVESDQLPRRVRGIIDMSDFKCRLLFRDAKQKRYLPEDCALMSGFTQFLSEEPVLGANVLDFLMVHQEYIPEDWKDYGPDICFWGTVYRDARGVAFVRYMYWYGEDQCETDKLWGIDYEESIPGWRVGEKQYTEDVGCCGDPVLGQ